MNKFFYYNNRTEGPGVNCIIEIYQGKKENIDFNNEKVRIIFHNDKNLEKDYEKDLEKRWFNVSMYTVSVWNQYMKEIKEEEIPAYKLIMGLA